MADVFLIVSLETVFIVQKGSDLVNPLRTEFLQIIYNNSVRTSQETHYVSATKPNRLMLFRETVAVSCENHTEHTRTLCGQNTEFYYVNAGGTYSNRCALEG
jgi:hypothetical protein